MIEQSATTTDPVCGMAVDIAVAMAKGLFTDHADTRYYFCGRGCKLEFDDGPDTLLAPDYVPSM